MTQFERGDLPLSGSRSKLLIPSESFDIWEDSDPDGFGEEVNERQQARENNVPWLRQKIDVENEFVLPEIPESSQQGPVSPTNGESDAFDGVRKAITKTPRKVNFRTEVPSSQTPPSTKHSARCAVRNEHLGTSPLKERSNNVSLSQQSPESQNITMRMLERTRLATRKVPFNDSALSGVPLEEENRTEKDEEPPQRQQFRQLQRVDTVQDSQADDGSSLIMVDSTERSNRTLRRVNSVQDSQCDDEELTLRDNGTMNELHYAFDNKEDSQYYGDDFEQATFDPAYSALDRDAARFGRTQTQPNFELVEESCDEDETEDEGDLNRGCTPNVKDRVRRPSNDTLQELDDPIVIPREHSNESPPQDANEEFTRKPEIPVPALQDDSAYKSGDPAYQKDAEVPSSARANPPHPSQVSTIVSTQMSASHPAPNALPSETSMPAQPFILPSSPPKLYSDTAETLSSSPLLLPPWSSPAHAPFTDSGVESQGSARKSDAQLESLVDFSLPPPPRLSSSRRQTPASSEP